MAENEKPVVAYLGPEGSYTHQAAQTAFPPAKTPATLTPVPTIDAVFSAVQSGLAHRGVVPFENSSNGSVVFTLDLFADLQGRYPGILVCDEAYVSVRHCLLGYASPASPSSSSQPGGEAGDGKDGNVEDGKPLHDLKHIRTLYSHPQAWGQCKTFLSKYLAHAERHDASSTSRAAEIAASDKSGSTAALSSPIAADLFGLNVLARSVNDAVENMTRFLVIRRVDETTMAAAAGEEAAAAANKETVNDATGDNEEEEVVVVGDEQDKFKSLITFTVEHSNPGALAACLTVFSRNGINLTSINTRPSGVERWNYIFFVEFKGRRRREDVCGDGGGGGVVNKALKELEGVCKGYRWLGSWENRLLD